MSGLLRPSLSPKKLLPTGMPVAGLGTLGRTAGFFAAPSRASTNRCPVVFAGCHRTRRRRRRLSSPHRCGRRSYCANLVRSRKRPGHGHRKAQPAKNPRAMAQRGERSDRSTPSRWLKRATGQSLICCSGGGRCNDSFHYWMLGREPLLWPGDSASEAAKDAWRERCAAHYQKLRKPLATGESRGTDGQKTPDCGIDNISYTIYCSSRRNPSEGRKLRRKKRASPKRQSHWPGYMARSRRRPSRRKADGKPAIYFGCSNLEKKWACPNRNPFRLLARVVERPCSRRHPIIGGSFIASIPMQF